MVFPTLIPMAPAVGHRAPRAQAARVKAGEGRQQPPDMIQHNGHASTVHMSMSGPPLSAKFAANAGKRSTRFIQVADWRRLMGVVSCWFQWLVSVGGSAGRMH